MYAVIETGGKQYRVELGTELAVERLAVNPGDSVEFDRVLLVADGESAHVGTPTVAQAAVTAQVVRQDRGDKVIVFKYRPKARHRAKKGHRQELTVLRVADIRLDGRSAAQEAGALVQEQEKVHRAAQAEAERKAAADQALAQKLAKATVADETSDEQASKAGRRTAKSTAAQATTAKSTGTKSRATKSAAAESDTDKSSAKATKASAGTAKPTRPSARPKTSPSGRTATTAAGADEPADKAKAARAPRGAKNTKRDS